MKIRFFSREVKHPEKYEFLKIASEAVGSELTIIPDSRINRQGNLRKLGTQAFFVAAIMKALAAGADGVLITDKQEDVSYEFLRLLSKVSRTWDGADVLAFSAGTIEYGRPVEDGLLEVTRLLDPHFLFINLKRSGQSPSFYRSVIRGFFREGLGTKVRTLGTGLGLFGSRGVEATTRHSFPLRRLDGRWVDAAQDDEIGANGHGAGKLCFLFLTRSGVYNKSLWADYLSDRSSANSVFHYCNKDQMAGWELDCSVKSAILTSWGDVSLVRATLLMLEEALRDPSNSFFVLCSESCIPICPLDEVLRRCRTTNASFANLEPRISAVGRIPAMADRNDPCTFIPDGAVYYHPQWIVLNRKMAEFYVRNDLTRHFESCFAPDEFYFGTLAAVAGFDLGVEFIDLRTTWTFWESERNAHPVTFESLPRNDLKMASLKGFFFARKFRDLSKEDDEFIRKLVNLG